MKTSITLCAVVLAAVATGSSLGAATALYDLNTTVLDGNTGENTYLSANGSGAGLSYNGATPSLTLTLPASGAVAQIIGNFSPTSLGTIGDSITLSYHFTVSSTSTFSTSDTTLRVGLFDSNGSAVTGNTTGAADSNVSTDLGYMAAYRASTGTVGAANTFYQRLSSNMTLFATSAYSNSSATFGGNTSPTMAGFGITTGTQTGGGSLTLTLIAGGVRLTSVVNGGGAQTLDDLSGTVTTFDEFGFFGLSGTTNPTITLTDLSVVYASAAIPEPSSCAFFYGLLFLVIAWMKPRKRGN